MKLASIQYWIYVDGISNKKTTQIIGNLVSGLHLTNKQSYFAVGKEERSSKKKNTGQEIVVSNNFRKRHPPFPPQPLNMQVNCACCTHPRFYFYFLACCY